MKLHVLLLSTVPSSVLGYFAQANNAHVEFISLSSSSGGGDVDGGSGSGSDGEDVDNNNLTNEAEWETLLHSALQGKLAQLNYIPSAQAGSARSSAEGGEGGAAVQSSSSGTTDNIIMKLFEEWAVKFDKEYESLSEHANKMLIWLENHGELPLSLSLSLALFWSHVHRLTDHLFVLSSHKQSLSNNTIPTLNKDYLPSTLVIMNIPI